MQLIWHGPQLCDRHSTRITNNVKTIKDKCVAFMVAFGPFACLNHSALGPVPRPMTQVAKRDGDFFCKVLIYGASEVGKTHLFRRYGHGDMHNGGHGRYSDTESPMLSSESSVMLQTPPLCHQDNRSCRQARDIANRTTAHFAPSLQPNIGCLFSAVGYHRSVTMA